MNEKSKAELVEMLKKFGFVCKPWKGYFDMWWFNGQPIFSLAAIKKPSDVITTCLVSFTEEARPHSDQSESDRRKYVSGLLETITEDHYVERNS